MRWEAMDAQLLRRFWERHAAERASAADISDRVLVFHRGISDVRLVCSPSCCFCCICCMPSVQQSCSSCPADEPGTVLGIIS